MSEKDGLGWLPEHKCGLYLTHNQHRDYYESLADYLTNREVEDDDWVAPGERERALAADSLWSLQWYPTTPIGFYVVYAASLDALRRYFTDSTPSGTEPQGEG